MIFTLALRNISRNKKRNIVIIILMTTILSLLFIGNSILMESDNGLKKSYIDNFTGDIIIMGKSDVDMTLFGANTPSIEEYFDIPIIKDFDAIMDYLENSGMGFRYTTQLSGASQMELPGYRDEVPLFGIAPESYFETFPYLKLEEGRFIEPGEQAVMISKSRALEIEKSSGKKIKPGQFVKLTMYNNIGFKIREVPIAGIFSYNSSNELLDKIVLCDPFTVRKLNNITLLSQTFTLADEDLMTLDDIDSLFSDAELFVEEEEDLSPVPKETHQSKNQEEEIPEEDNFSTGWHFILIKIPDGLKGTSVLKQLNEDLSLYEVKAVDWRRGAGGSALLVMFLRFCYNGGFFLVLIAGIIAIINILIISIMERTKEIGTLRALGASKSYILRMLLLEIMTLTLFSGIIANLGGILILFIINSAHITLTNSLIVSLLGQSTLDISFYPSLIMQTILLSLVTAFGSSLLPIQRALRIQPVTAVSKG